MPLVIHIIDKNFSWATTDTGTGSFLKIRRSVDRDDLKQVGVIALLTAGEKYNPEHPSNSSFKTYAYKIIYNAILNHLDSNCTPLSMPSRRYILKTGSVFLKGCLAAATNYSTFSELSNRSKIHEATDFVPRGTKDVDAAADPALIAEKKDFQEHCINKLKDNLTEEEYRILLLRFSKMTYRQIGDSVGLSYEAVRKHLRKLNKKVRDVLSDEIAEFGSDKESTKTLAQLARLS
jgi:RNA polymerase sigma factor (sigma-70 family)